MVETVEGEGRHSVASDYVFVDDKDTFYYLNFSINNAEDALISTVRDLKINLQRNRLTIIRGEFLTRDIDDGELASIPVSTVKRSSYPSDNSSSMKKFGCMKNIGTFLTIAAVALVAASCRSETETIDDCPEISITVGIPDPHGRLLQGAALYH